MRQEVLISEKEKKHEILRAHDVHSTDGVQLPEWAMSSLSGPAFDKSRKPPTGDFDPVGRIRLREVVMKSAVRSRINRVRLLPVALAVIGLTVLGHAQQGQAQLDRTVLPIPEPKYPPITELDARKVMPPRASR
jgi:hypothetical protein